MIDNTADKIRNATDSEIRLVVRAITESSAKPVWAGWSEIYSIYRSNPFINFGDIRI